MPTYGKNNFKESNVNYLNKDFSALKTSLMNYAKSYFPDTYRDFNETSPGMMLIEMNAYVGDILSFYIDKQYQEMLLPLAEERRNIITMAKMFGYKVKPIVPAYVDLKFTSDVNASTLNPENVDYSDAGVFNSDVEIASSGNSNTIFTTLEPIDFKISASNDTETIASTTEAGLASTYTLSRTVKGMSATEKTITFQVGIPEKFRTITIPDKNVIDIISCVDSNNNEWYEVDFLAQDKVPIQTHYTEDINRDSAYSAQIGGLDSSTAVPFSLTYKTTPKRFTRETNLDNTTSLVFGNGILKDGQLVDEGYIDLEQIGIVIPGQTNDLNDFVDPTLGDEYSTLGETPNQTTLTITYRVGGGINSNVPSGDLTTLPTPLPTATLGDSTLTGVTNEKPARGGKDQEDTIEIKERAKAFFSTQNRCVTKEDYEARVLNVPSKFGNIAKAYVTRDLPNTGLNEEYTSNISRLNDDISLLRNKVESTKLTLDFAANQAGVNFEATLRLIRDGWFADPTPTINQYAIGSAFELLATSSDSLQPEISNIQPPTINIYVLGYNNKKQLVGNPYANQLETTDSLPITLTSNIANYLENFKIMTDTIIIQDGYIVNFGVFFDVIAEKYANKQKVKLDCIQKIKDYFRIEKMQFNQPIYKSNLEYELMGVEGVRSIGHVTITQKLDYYETGTDELSESTYRYSYVIGDGTVDINNDGTPDGSFTNENNSGADGYGYKYDFQTALSDDGKIVLPPNVGTPTVFELKNPNQNIQGRVR